MAISITASTVSSFTTRVNRIDVLNYLSNFSKLPVKTCLLLRTCYIHAMDGISPRYEYTFSSRERGLEYDASGPGYVTLIPTSLSQCCFLIISSGIETFRRSIMGEEKRQTRPVTRLTRFSSIVQINRATRSW